MNPGIKNFIVDTNAKEWQPLVEKEIHYKGIHVKSLRHDEESSRSPTILLKFEAGAVYPYHNHPGGEEVFVLEGDVLFNEKKLSAGDYLYTPAGFTHKVKSENGCVLLLIVPEEVEILEEG